MSKLLQRSLNNIKQTLEKRTRERVSQPTNQKTEDMVDSQTDSSIVASMPVSSEPEKPRKTAEIIQLPDWRDFERGAPSCTLRSALFGVIRRGRRKYLESIQLASWGNDAISYTGQQLDQADLDVWLELLHLARENPLGQNVQFERYALLRRLGRCTGSKDWQWLETSIKRMIACCVEIRVGSKRYLGSLVERGYIDDETGRYVMALNPDLVKLFEVNYTLQHTEARRLLKTDLAKWLCSYIESHKASKDHPHKIGVSKLYELCGSETKQLRDFRLKLKKAAAELQTQKIIASWRLTESDVLEIVKY